MDARLKLPQQREGCVELFARAEESRYSSAGARRTPKQDNFCDGH